jgi:DNA polymerase I-like protein with 3'-5' exonuclease and polymerase domains
VIRLGDLYPERKKELDFHWRTAISVWGTEAVKENRYTAKRINFQKMYGGSPKGCAASVGIPLDLAKKVSRAFEDLAPGYVAWDRQMREAAARGMKSFTTYSGRPVWLTGKGEHAVGNAAIQGTAREFLVDAVAKWESGPWGGHVIVPVHDELICFDIPEAEAHDATAFLVSCMESELNGVKIIAEANEPSPYWLDASL